MRPTVGIGAVLIVVGAGVLALAGETAGTGVQVLVVLLAVFGTLAALWRLTESPGAGDASVIAPPWTDDGALFDRPPERTRDDDVLSGESFAAILAEAGEAARADRSLEAGFETVRPVLGRALADALSLRAGDRDDAEQAIETGAWTDDPVAAAVLEPTLSSPPLSLRGRIEAWLFPERVVRRRLQRTIQAIAEAGEAAVPNVPGQNAPRSVPVLQPALEDLQRGVDGRVQRAVDPLSTAQGPRPPGSDDRSIELTEADRNGADDSDEPTDEREAGDTTTADTAATANGTDGSTNSERASDDSAAAEATGADRDLFAESGGDRR